MENFGSAHTAEELFQFLSKIPEEQRKRLPIGVVPNEDDDISIAEIGLNAFEVTETQGCMQRGLIISYVPEQYMLTSTK